MKTKIRILRFHQPHDPHFKHKYCAYKSHLGLMWTLITWNINVESLKEDVESRLGVGTLIEEYKVKTL